MGLWRDELARCTCVVCVLMLSGTLYTRLLMYAHTHTHTVCVPQDAIHATRGCARAAMRSLCARDCKPIKCWITEQRERTKKCARRAHTHTHVCTSRTIRLKPLKCVIFTYECRRAEAQRRQRRRRRHWRAKCTLCMCALFIEL